MVLNREAICKRVTKAGQLPAYYFVPPNTGGYTSQHSLEQSIEKAKALMTEAGFPDGKGFPILEILYNTSEAHRVIAEAIQQMWKEALNIEVTLNNQDWKVYLSNQRTLNYQISRSGWIGDYNDPNTFLDMFVKLKFLFPYDFFANSFAK